MTFLVVKQFDYPPLGGGGVGLASNDLGVGTRKRNDLIPYGTDPPSNLEPIPLHDAP